MLAPKQAPPITFYRTTGKRLVDIVCAILLLVCLSPVIVVTALLVRWNLGSPVLFQQLRAGLHGQPFTLFKFRSMLNTLDQSGRPLADDIRLTSFGRTVRKLSLDELPQLVNVLRGEMSLVGPRPLLVDYLPRYDQHQARRHDVRPGITGLAQVKGRNSLSWPEKFDLDIEYAERMSFLLDLRILAGTALRVVVPQGVAADGQATMPEFLGNHEQEITT